MRTMMNLGLLLSVIVSAACAADQDDEKITKQFLTKLFLGDVAASIELSGLPFSCDRKELLDSNEGLKKAFGEIVTQNGKVEIQVKSVIKKDKAKGMNPKFKEDVNIYDAVIILKGAESKMEIYIRKSDGKVSGIFG
jgi:hypothetical protein